MKAIRIQQYGGPASKGVVLAGRGRSSSSHLKPWCGGTEPVSECIGRGSHAPQRQDSQLLCSVQRHGGPGLPVWSVDQIFSGFLCQPSRRASEMGLAINPARLFGGARRAAHGQVPTKRTRRNVSFHVAD